MRDSDIHAVVSEVKKTIRRWKEPVLGVVARETRDPFRILIACLLSLRTKDQTTDEASQRLFQLANTPESMRSLSIRAIEKAIYPVGFYKNKAKQIRGICQSLLRDFGGRVPDTIEELLTLKGVGRKTANLVVTVGYRKPGICVDIHVHRISNRWGYVQTRTPEETERALRQKLPATYWITFNDWLVPFGQHLCRPVSPFCSQCPVSQYCKRVGVRTCR
ncbi:MAG: endonuclease III [Nitrospira sp.]|nr:endonuclease III [Nitrospira sp.]MDE0404536.1 endonuclease III [Nitrospira sp.]MDE0486246.1 endonuclease III [Nitrospira sp.]